jgi:hypothetical protein
VQERFFRLVELVFTAYAVPALMVPFVWLGLRLLRAVRPAAPTATAERLNRTVAAYGSVSALWIAAGTALWLGIPLEQAGKTSGVFWWVAYGVLNAVLATLLVRFTAGYGDVPEGEAKDRLFLRFLSAVVVQPVATACAFAVLYRVMGFVYHLRVPGLPAVQEGI